jgi:hypothetical protein
MADKEFIHQKPAWQDRADFTIGALVVDDEWKKTWKTEQLASRQIGEQVFEICCIPALIYDINIGDVVETDCNFTVTNLFERGVYLGFRLVLKDQQYTKILLDALEVAQDLSGFVVEDLGHLMYGVSIKRGVDALTLTSCLDALITDGYLMAYESTTLK